MAADWQRDGYIAVPVSREGHALARVSVLVGVGGSIRRRVLAAVLAHRDVYGDTGSIDAIMVVPASADLSGSVAESASRWRLLRYQPEMDVHAITDYTRHDAQVEARVWGLPVTLRAGDGVVEVEP